MFKLEPGDISVLYRKKYDTRWFMFWKYLLQRLICFFTTEYWLGEKTSNVYHAEIITGQIDDKEFRVFTMEPPYARFKDRKFRRCVIFRLNDVPTDFEKLLDDFLLVKFGTKYEYTKILVFVLDWMFRTTWFSRKLNSGSRNVCSENVAEFYEEYVRQRCSAKEFVSTTPDDILDFCRTHPELYEVIFESRW